MENKLSLELRLIKLGFKVNLKGVTYIAEAVEIVGKNEDISFTKELYPLIAKKHNATATKIERAIRNAIETSFDELSSTIIQFVSTKNISRGKTSNNEMITLLSKLNKEDLI